MKFANPAARLFIPEGISLEAALARCTHLGVGAHADDLEFMAYHGILAGYSDPTQSFGGVICTDGAGSSRTEVYANHSDEALRAVRQQEQEAAAKLGQYGVMIQLAHSSSEIRQPGETPLVEDLKSIFAQTRPRILYTHNPADKHETHVGVFAATLRALRSLPVERRPRQVWGCEVWRDLDWMLDSEKVALDVSGNPDLAAALNGVFDSQIAGGKRYDLGILGRRRANATFYESHSSDEAQMLSFAMDLTPLIQNDSLSVADYVLGYLDRFRADVAGKLGKYFDA